ncbi:MAG TPA: hypothetical protein VG474_06005 [Solirubrobacteraceae bacterium]|nr:hypothetical protein [Solirubrobacteraceae bacterium]
MLAGCGGQQRRDADVPGATYTVAVERASFPREQRLAQRNVLVMSVRNAGRRAIPNLAVTVRGFTTRSGGSRQADLGRDLWIIDRGPQRARTAAEDTWTAGRLEPDATATLRWDVTPVVAGRHRLTYAVAPALTGPARAELATGGEARGSLTVRVSDEPARSRVDPASGEVRRQE